MWAAAKKTFFDRIRQRACPGLLTRRKQPKPCCPFLPSFLATLFVSFSRARCQPSCVTRKTLRRTVVFLLLLWPCLGHLPADPACARDLSGAELLLTGLYVNGSEQGMIDVLYRPGQENNYWLDLETVANATGLQPITDQNGILHLKTPIGEAHLSPDELWRRENRTYLSTEQLWDLVKIRARFDQALFALLLDVPWRPGSRLYDKTRKPHAHKPLTPDVKAPDTSLSFVRLRASYERFLDSNSDDYETTLDSGGAMAGGTWLLGLRHQQGDEARLDRYFWNRELEHNVFRLGTSYIDLGQLLDSSSYTGVQWAWSNRAISRYTDFASDLNFDSFLSDDLDIQRDILREDGPPGGIAELRMDGRPVARVRVGLQGNYSFRNIPVRTGSYQVIQIYLYPRTLADTPRIINLTRSTIREMISAGEWLLRGGAGETGNILYRDYGSPPDGSQFGFLLARHGLTESLTLQGVAQYSEQGDVQIMAGLRTALGEHWAWAFDAARRKSASGLLTEIIGEGTDWDFHLRSRWYERGYGTNRFDDEYDTYLHTFYHFSDTLRLGLIGRFTRDAQQKETDFLLPGAYWRPLADVSLSGIPNLDGEYRYQADWYINAYLRFSAAYENELLTLTGDYHHSEALFFQTGVDYRKDQDDYMLHARLHWYIDNNQYNYLQAGASSDGESTGYFVSLNRIFTPGVELRVELNDDFRHYTGLGTDEGPMVTALLRVDLGLTGSSLVPTDNQRINFSRGGIAGFLKDQNGRRVAVDNVSFRVNGRVPPQEQQDGVFHVSDLRPGVYTLEIDEENLPIEYVPVRRQVKVEVARAAVTQVDFKVRAEYSFAGRVLRRNKPVAGALLIVHDHSGAVVDTIQSNRFGYYRTNPLLPGRYRIKVIRINGQPLQEPVTERVVVLDNDYLFGQDIRL